MMRGSRFLVASSLVLSLLGAGEALAQKAMVVVEQFGGPGSDRFREAVIEALGKSKTAAMVPDKKVAAAEADLGLIATSDAYGAMAKQVGAQAFVAGKITAGSKPKATLTVRNADGDSVGAASWTEKSAARLQADLKKEVGGKLAALLGKIAAAAPMAEAPAKAPPVVEDRPAAKAEAPAEQAPPVERAAASEPATEVTDQAGAEADLTGGGLRSGYTIAVGTMLYSRNFSYNQSLRGGQLGHKLPLSAAPGVTAEVFPHANIGGVVAFEYTVPTLSKDSSTGFTYRTNGLAYLVGLKLRYELAGIELNGLVGYGMQEVKITPEANDPSPPDVAGVSYKHVRAGLGAAYPLSPSMRLVAGGNYLHILDAGEVAGPDYFEFATSVGGHAYGGLIFGLPWLSGLDGRAVVDFKRVVFNMNVDPTSARTAGGAVDQYIGLNLAFGYSGGL